MQNKKSMVEEQSEEKDAKKGALKNLRQQAQAVPNTSKHVDGGRGFTPMFNFNDMYENQGNINEISLDVGAKLEHSPNKDVIGNNGHNEISVIQNNNTLPDTSMNTTQFSLVNRLHNSHERMKKQIPDNFDQQSSTSYLFNEDELAKYEEDIQVRINEIWTETQVKTELIQNEYQNNLEQIIEDQTSMKFERMAEIKFMYKKFQDDPEKMKERDQELEGVKQEMELLKQKKIKEAKLKMEERKKYLQVDK